MKTRLIHFILIAVVAVCLFAHTMTVHADGPWYVKSGASGGCTSWLDACDLQYALTHATSGEIWVAAGTYKPTTDPIDRSATFQLVSDVAVYGGFPAAGGTLADRNPTANLTVLSGDIDGNDNQTPVITDLSTAIGNAANSHVVVTGVDSAILDGFTITAGFNAGSDGAGMYNITASPSLIDVIFRGNSAANGGGMYNFSYSSPSLTRVTFDDNAASNHGGGMYNYSNCNPTLIDVTFNDNTAVNFGGGMYNNYSSAPSLTRVIFSHNSAATGGGLYVANTSMSYDFLVTDATFDHNSAINGGGIASFDSNMTLKQVTFNQNPTTGNGGGLYNYSLSWGYEIDLTNSTFTGNTADEGGGIYTHHTSTHFHFVTLANNQARQGGGIYNDQSSTGTYFYDSIVWGNTATDSGNQIVDVSSSSQAYASVFEDGFGGNTSSPVLLGTLGSNGGFTQTIPILAGSSAIDLISKDDCESTTVDQRGVTRPQGNGCDAGAFEFQFPPVVYAVPGGLTTGACDSWANGCELRYALTQAVTGQEIWAKAGTYKPTNVSSDRDASFTLLSGVPIYGGFAGTETLRSERNFTSNITILSGDIDDNDSQKPIITDINTVTGNSANSKHVVTGVTGATLDGFTITAGYSDGVGGGMDSENASPTLVNVTFSGNTAMIGGGVYQYKSTSSFTNVVFTSNSAGSGGGMLSDQSSPTLADVTFSHNLAYSHSGSGIYDYGGGGMYSYWGSPTLTNVTFTANTSNGSRGGGGLFTYGISSNHPVLTNVTFNGNSAPTNYHNGGGMYSFNDGPVLQNVTFSNNTADYQGGGFYVNGGAATVINSIFYGNTSSTDPGFYTNSGGSTITFSVVQGGYAGDGNLSTDPKLGTLGSYGGLTQTIPLLPGSSAIDTGSGVSCAGTDQRGFTRPQGSGCDMGAFEYRPLTITLSSAAADPANTSPIAVSVTFSTPVTGFVSASIAPVNATVSNLMGSGSAYTFDLTPTSQGTVTTAISAGAVTDNYGNANQAAAFSRSFDSVPPVVVSSLRASPNPAFTTSVSFTVTFTELVNGVDASDFSLTVSHISGASITTVSGSGSVYTVTIHTGTGSGTLRLDVVDNNTILDAASNPLGGAGPHDGNYTTGEVYTLRTYFTFLPQLKNP